MNKEKQFLLWGGLVAIIGLIIWGIMAAPSTPSDSNGTVPGLTEGDRYLGSRDAKVVLIEYSDFQCPACKQVEPTVKKVLDKYGDQILYIYRYYPLTQIHRNAQISSQAAEAVGQVDEQNFWKYHDRLFSEQTTWATVSNPRSLFTQYAKDLGVDAGKFTAAMDSKEVKDRVNRDTASGNSAKVQGTPTFFLNGKSITTPNSLDGFSKLIDDALAQ